MKPSHVRTRSGFSALESLVAGLLLAMAAATAVAAWTQLDRVPAERRKLQRARAVARNTAEALRAISTTEATLTFDCDIHGNRVLSGSTPGVFRVDATRSAAPGTPNASSPDGLDEIHVRVVETSTGACVDDLRVWVAGTAR